MSFGKILLFGAFFASSISMATPKKNSANPRIKQAHKLFLDEKRKDAIALLLEATPPLKEEALRLSERFLTEGAQREYEMAESMRFSGASQARLAYEKALELEADNLMVHQSLLLLAIEQSRCEAAENHLLSIEGIFPAHPRRKYFQALVGRCKGDDGFPQDIESEGQAIEPQFVLLQQAHFYLKKQQIYRAEPIVKKLLEEQHPPPEAYMLAWRIKAERGQKAIDELKKYIQVCKSSGEVDKRKFKWDPFYCSQISEAEETVRKEDS